jgi:hypothetical protein
LACVSYAPLAAATRPRYGGTLRVELHAPFESADPPQSGPGMSDLSGAFSMTLWEGGRRATFVADENAAGGRPFLDSVEIRLARSPRDQSLDLELGKADLVELGPNEWRRAPAGRVIWSSRPVRIVALVFQPRVTDERIREALSFAVDRTAIWNVLLQRQGEVSAALLPQWLSGYAFIFPTAADLPRARALVTAAPIGGRVLTLGVTEPALRAIADRILLNARDTGITLSIVPEAANADIRLIEARISSTNAAPSLAALATAFGLPEPAHTDTPEGQFAAERSLLEGARVIPLVHLPDIYGAAPRVKGGQGISPLGEWRFGDLWIEAPRQ